MSKVIEVGAIDEAKREALGTQLRSAVAAQDLEATLASIRGKAGINVRAEALEKKEDGPAPSSAPPKPGPPNKFGGLLGGK
jgi:hypothetical protein